MVFTINAGITQPPLVLRKNKETTQEASFIVKRTGYPSLSPFISKGKDGDAQPRFMPTDSIPKFPIKIIDFY